MEYVSSAEHKRYPFFATQWHPEKPPFEFGMHEIPHTLEAVLVSQHLVGAPACLPVCRSAGWGGWANVMVTDGRAGFALLSASSQPFSPPHPSPPPPPLAVRRPTCLSTRPAAPRTAPSRRSRRWS